jgi:hypothetical protein
VGEGAGVVIEHWDDEEPFEEAVVLPAPTQPIIAGVALEPCLILRDDAVQHLREKGTSFSLCGARTAQPLTRDDPRRASLSLCAVCETAAGGDGA